MFLFYVRLINSIRDEEAFGWKGHCEDRMREWQEITGPFWRDVGVVTLMTERLRLGVWSCMDLSLDKHVVIFFFSGDGARVPEQPNPRDQIPED